MSEPPWEKMYNELEQRHVALAQIAHAKTNELVLADCLMAETATFLDRLAEHLEQVLGSSIAADCRERAERLRK